MYIEYCINSIDEKDIEVQTNVAEVIKYPISAIVAPIPHIKYIKKKISSNILYGTFIDYPLAYSDINRRQDLILDAAKIGVNFINIPIPFYYIVNRKYDKFREDIQKNLEICKRHKIDIRYMLEYRKFDHLLLTKICDILKKNDIHTVYPSTGFFIDNLQDSIIACSYLHSRTGINTIINSTIWRKEQMVEILKTDPYGYSSTNPSSFYLIDQEHYENK